MPGVPCPHCSYVLPREAPYPARASEHKIIMECVKPPGCGKLVRCDTMGKRIVGVKPIPRSRIPGVLGRFQSDPKQFWKYEVSQLLEEARMTNYLGFGERGAAICLRIILENVINIQLLGKDPKRPKKFPHLERAVTDAVKFGSLDIISCKTTSEIKLLGDQAAHPAAYGNVPVTPARVDYAIWQLEGLLGTLGVLK